MEIRTKAEFFEKWELGLLGNRTQLWRPGQWREAIAGSQHADGVGFRQLGTGGGGAWEKAPHTQVQATHDRWVAAGRNFRMDDGVPNDKTTMQGEVCRTWRGIEAFLCWNPPGVYGMEPMRRTMAAGKHRHVGGATLRALMDRYMDPSSQEDLFALLDLYPDATIEFACFAVDVGVMRNRNTIFWEVRNY